jgi:hypothetical protein
VPVIGQTGTLMTGRLFFGCGSVSDWNEGLIMTTLLFTIDISADYQGTKEIYSAQVRARNGQQLYHLAEAESIPEALEKVVQEMQLQEKTSASFRT